MSTLFILLQFQSHRDPNYLSTLFWLVIILIIFNLLIARSENIGHWSVLYPNMNHDPEDYYQKIVEILKSREVPDLHSQNRIFKEGGYISHQRLYLEVSRGDYIYHICGAPWGTDFFFSWWMRKRYSPIERIFVKIPVLGPIIKIVNETDTYYKLDTDGAFNASVQNAVQEAINHLTDSKGGRRLTDLERVPKIQSLIK